MSEGPRGIETEGQRPGVRQRRGGRGWTPEKGSKDETRGQSGGQRETGREGETGRGVRHEGEGTRAGWRKFWRRRVGPAQPPPSLAVRSGGRVPLPPLLYPARVRGPAWKGTKAHLLPHSRGPRLRSDPGPTREGGTRGERRARGPLVAAEAAPPALPSPPPSQTAPRRARSGGGGGGKGEGAASKPILISPVMSAGRGLEKASGTLNKKNVANAIIEGGSRRAGIASLRAPLFGGGFSYSKQAHNGLHSAPRHGPI